LSKHNLDTQAVSAIDIRLFAFAHLLGLTLNTPDHIQLENN